MDIEVEIDTEELKRKMNEVIIDQESSDGPVVTPLYYTESNNPVFRSECTPSSRAKCLPSYVSDIADYAEKHSGKKILILGSYESVLREQFKQLELDLLESNRYLHMEDGAKKLAELLTVERDITPVEMSSEINHRPTWDYDHTYGEHLCGSCTKKNHCVTRNRYRVVKTCAGHVREK